MELMQNRPFAHKVLIFCGNPTISNHTHLTMQTFRYAAAIFIGGGLGSLARWGLSAALAPYSAQFPNGTLAANLLSCLVVGVMLAYANHAVWGDGLVRALVITGFCGGFSTFSTLIREMNQLQEANRLATMLSYGLVSFLAGLLALLAGMWLGTWLGTRL